MTEQPHRVHRAISRCERERTNCENSSVEGGALLVLVAAMSQLSSLHSSARKLTLELRQGVVRASPPPRHRRRVQLVRMLGVRSAVLMKFHRRATAYSVRGDLETAG